MVLPVQQDPSFVTAIIASRSFAFGVAIRHAKLSLIAGHNRLGRGALPHSCPVVSGL